MGIDRRKSGQELLLARSIIALNANIAGVDAIDTVFSDIKDLQGFRAEVESARNLGFSGKSCIHPSQIEVVHDVFTPSIEDIESSLRIIKVAKLADIEKGGVILIDGKMVDIPVIAKAERVVKFAKGAGIRIGGCRG